MPFAKTTIIVALTEELARFSDPSAEALVRNDMIQVMATFQDQQFIDPTVTASAALRPASITNGITPIPSSGNTIAAITADLAAALGAMRGTNLPMESLHWVLHPRTETYLQLLRGTMDTFVFGAEMAGGRLLGIPFISSTSVPVGAGPTFATTITLIAASEVFLADDGGVTLDVSREASIQLDSTPATPPTPMVSLWQQNLVGIRAEQYIYWMRRQPQGVQVISGVDY
jgi:HK97 family phage major capsid protein